MIEKTARLRHITNGCLSGRAFAGGGHVHNHRFPIVIAAALAVALVTAPLCTPANADEPAANTSSIPFGPQSFWRTQLDSAPIDPASQTIVDYMVSTITDRYSGVAAFNAHQYDSHLYTAGQTTPTTDFAFDDCQGKGYVPSGLVGADGQFTNVPVPTDAVAAAGSDAELSIYSPSTDQLWEFWRAHKRSDGTWSACWGGRIDHVSASPGYFSGSYGATATGLPNAGGLVRLSEIRSGRIDHTMSLAIPNPAISSNYRWPAQRSDGSDSSSAALPEGSRLRLDPTLDLSRFQLSPAALTIARAAQQCGFVVVDKSGAVSVLAEAVAPVGTDPDPWRQLLGTPDYAVMKNFPWSKLQVVADGWRGQAIADGTSSVSGESTAQTPSPAPVAVTGNTAQVPSPAPVSVTSGRDTGSDSSASVEAGAGPTPAAPTSIAPHEASDGDPSLTEGAKSDAAPQKAANEASAAAQKAAELKAARERAAARKAAEHRAALRKAAAHRAAAHRRAMHKIAARKAAARKIAAHRAAAHKIAAHEAAAHEAAARKGVIRKARDRSHVDHS